MLTYTTSASCFTPCTKDCFQGHARQTVMPSLYIEERVLMYNMSDVPVVCCRCPHPLHSPGQMPRPQPQRLLLVVSLGEAHPVPSLLGNSRMH